MARFTRTAFHGRYYYAAILTRGIPCCTISGEKHDKSGKTRGSLSTASEKAAGTASRGQQSMRQFRGRLFLCEFISSGAYLLPKRGLEKLDAGVPLQYHNEHGPDPAGASRGYVQKPRLYQISAFRPRQNARHKKRAYQRAGRSQDDLRQGGKSHAKAGVYLRQRRVHRKQGNRLRLESAGLPPAAAFPQARE